MNEMKIYYVVPPDLCKIKENNSCLDTVRCIAESLRACICLSHSQVSNGDRIVSGSLRRRTNDPLNMPSPEVSSTKNGWSYSGVKAMMLIRIVVAVIDESNTEGWRQRRKRRRIDEGRKSQRRSDEVIGGNFWKATHSMRPLDRSIRLKS
jgi:hypothetical protein